MRKMRAARCVASLRAAISLWTAAFAAAASGTPIDACAFCTDLRMPLIALTTHRMAKIIAMVSPFMCRFAYDVGGGVGVVGGAPPDWPPPDGWPEIVWRIS